MVLKGFYIVHRFEGDYIPLKLNKYVMRESRIYYPRVLRYHERECAEGIFSVNEFGDVVLFQRYNPKIGCVSNPKEAYENGVEFDEHYKRAMLFVSAALVKNIQDSSDSFLLEISDKKGEVGGNWSFLQIPVRINNTFGHALLSEAMFIYSLCRRTERYLYEFSEINRMRLSSFRPVVQSGGDLVMLEMPSQFLVNKEEIEFMREIYDKWNLGISLSALQERIGQLISSWSILINERQARNIAFLNWFVAAAGLLALMSVTRKLELFIVFADASTLDLGLIGLALALFVFATLKFFVLDLIRGFWSYIMCSFYRKKLRRKGFLSSRWL